MQPPRGRHSAADTEEGSGEGYLASAADLMIGLLFVFIILVVVLALEQRRKEQLAEAQREALLQERRALLGTGDPRGQVTRAIGDSLRKVLPNVVVNPESGVITLPEDALFEVGESRLTDEGRSALVQASEELTRILPCYVANRRQHQTCSSNPSGHEIETVFIEGHTDNRPMRRLNYDNTQLSLDRARSVGGAMVTGQALDAYRNKLGQPIFSLSAYGESRLLPGIAPDDRRNRRVDLRLVLSYRPLEEILPALTKAAVSTE